MTLLCVKRYEAEKFNLLHNTACPPMYIRIRYTVECYPYTLVAQTSNQSVVYLSCTAESHSLPSWPSNDRHDYVYTYTPAGIQHVRNTYKSCF